MSTIRDNIEELGNMILEAAQQRNKLIEQEARETGKVHSVTAVIISDNGPFRQSYGGMTGNNELLAAALICHNCKIDIDQLKKIVQILNETSLVK